MYGIVATDGVKSSQVKLYETMKEINAEKKELYNEGYKYLSVYKFNENGLKFTKHYTRSSRGWHYI